jgi:hypothetical protein
VVGVAGRDRDYRRPRDVGDPDGIKIVILGASRP